ncbi:Deformed epidermal autoregulatory factor 1-like protein [Trichoplax sp. H2]|nr:Deformed epidermal autoregulatory factor 1-like protein [Trichoplax sp. H2]|eukprot:RDD43775.1 Deformed epidermal autoregulatory factor 1-like protein [Trichoplax sp. H2]
MDLTVKQHSTDVTHPNTGQNIHQNKDGNNNHLVKSATTSRQDQATQSATGNHNNDNLSYQPTTPMLSKSTAKGTDKTILPEKRIRFVANNRRNQDTSNKTHHTTNNVTVSQATTPSKLADDIKYIDKAIHSVSTLNQECDRNNTSSSSVSPTSSPPQLPSHSNILSDHEEQDTTWLHRAHHSDMLQVTCHDRTAEFYKSKFITGTRGKCIKLQSKWYTPIEFETACGITSSKDWGRNITYAGHPLHQLIRAGIIAVHVVSTQNPTHGPCPLFIPFKRKNNDNGYICNEREDDGPPSSRTTKLSSEETETITLTSTKLAPTPAVGPTTTGFHSVPTPAEMSVATSTPSSTPLISTVSGPAVNIGIPILQPIHAIKQFPAMAVTENSQFSIANTLTTEQYMLLKMEEAVNSMVIIGSQLKSMIDQLKFFNGFTNSQYIDSANLNTRPPYVGRREESTLQHRTNNKNFTQKEPVDQ